MIVPTRMREPPTGDTHDITFQVSGFHIWTNQLAAHMIKPVISVKKAKWPAVMRGSLPAQAIAEAPGSFDALYRFDDAGTWPTKGSAI